MSDWESEDVWPRPTPPPPRQTPGERPCRASGCDRPAQQGEYCYGHYKRRLRQQSMSRPFARRYATPMECLEEAALNYADADVADDGVWDRARHRLRMAARRVSERSRRRTRAQRDATPVGRLESAATAFVEAVESSARERARLELLEAAKRYVKWHRSGGKEEACP